MLKLYTVEMFGNGREKQKKKEGKCNKFIKFNIGFFICCTQMDVLLLHTC